MTPAEECRRDLEAWLEANQLASWPRKDSRDLASLVARLTPVYERAQRPVPLSLCQHEEWNGTLECSASLTIGYCDAHANVLRERAEKAEAALTVACETKDYWAKHTRKAEAERDEARLARDDFKKLLEASCANSVEATRQRDALQARVEELQRSVDAKEQLAADWQASCLLGVDPDGLTPEHNERQIVSLQARVGKLEAVVEAARMVAGYHLYVGSLDLYVGSLDMVALGLIPALAALDAEPKP